jgi:acyl carrier protein phosphodiesterase
MNFLAHIYLSNDEDFVKIGNFMEDGIQGKSYSDFHYSIQKGILLHRAIDTFTDAHPIFRQSTKRLHANYHHYSGVIVDIFYDHFLAKNWQQYSPINLSDFVDDFHQLLESNYELLTPKTKRLLPYMIAQNWLKSYQTVNGIEVILTQMDQRISSTNKMQNSVVELNDHYDEFEAEFFLFFEDLRQFVKVKIMELN